MIFSQTETGDYAGIKAFARCPSCQRLITMKSFADAVIEGARECPFCHVFIEKKQIIASCEAYLKITKAVQAAGEITSKLNGISVPVALVFFEMLFIYLSNTGKYNPLFFLTLFVSVMIFSGGLFNTYEWISEFGSLKTSDEEYRDAGKKVRQAQIIWVWANIINVLWWIIYVKFLDLNESAFIRILLS
ncbi:MAG TPA: hypothetical protein VIL74_24395 [Pyrinomonadaceae bacterium]|jgi:hypothetical protein